MNSEKQLTDISKFLSLILRHEPATIGIALDEYGWVDVNTLIEKSNEYGVKFDMKILCEVVNTNSKKRFAFNETADKIRASQGHSVDIELGYINQRPPEILYHGTSEDAIQSILSKGLEKGNRNHVHLSANRDTAFRVGQRHGKPFVFKVFAAQMYQDNFNFYLSDNGVWLTNGVPIKYLQQ